MCFKFLISQTFSYKAIKCLFSLTVITSFIFISACQQKSVGDSYLNELSNVLEVSKDELVPKHHPALKRLASKRLMRESVYQNFPILSEKDSLSIREFLSIKQCRLQQTLAEKNNSLGKIAPPSQQLLNSLAFIEQAPECIETLRQEGNYTLAEKISSNLDYKKQTIPSVLWNAILNEDENRRFWKVSTEKKLNVAIGETSTHLSDALFSLEEFIKLAANHNSTKHINLEEVLSHLRNGRGGEIYNNYQALAQILDQANQLINKAINKPFCHAGHKNPKANYFMNVVTNRFIGEIQKSANQIELNFRQTVVPMQKIEDFLSDYEPTEYAQWRMARNTAFKQLRNAPKLHVKSIQALFEQCGLSPVQPASN